MYNLPQKFAPHKSVLKQDYNLVQIILLSGRNYIVLTLAPFKIYIIRGERDLGRQKN